MSLILHLSDLHLLPPDSDEEIGDYKVELVPKGERQTRVTLLRNTLRGLRLRLQEEGEHLDAIVVSGDITYQGSPEGLDLLPDLLSELASELPSPDRIVVVPGNHDVGFGTAPGSRERYEQFVSKVRDRGYVTPRLDGIDTAATHAVLVTDSYVIVAMNSCDYSVAVEPISAAATGELEKLISSGSISEDLEKEISRLRLYDAARMNGDQLRAVSDALLAADPENKKLRIVTFHHHLLPVTLNEEMKSFESFSNLGEVRNFLSDSHVDMVLHGHKHVGRILLDSYSSLHEGSAPDERYACMIVSGGTIGAQVGVGGEVAKLIRIDAHLPRTRRVIITSLPALGAGSSLPAAMKQWQVPLRSPVARDTAGLTLRGRSAADVHEALEDLHRYGDHSGPVICVIEEAAGADSAPPTYPQLESAATQIDDWFAGQVRWWQSHAISEGKPFTHGDYIRRWRGHRDQLTEAVDALRASPQTSRAVVTLFDPPGALDNQDVSFPSFTLLAFKLRGEYLDATAFFRKQEMRYWWAINVAEIATLQTEVSKRVTNGTLRVLPGRITTVTSEAVFSDVAPKVAVPLMDQYAWREPIEFARIAAAIHDQSMPGRSKELAKAEVMFSELTPPAEMPEDGPYVSIAGPRALLGALNGMGDCYGQDLSPSDLVAKVEALVDKNMANANLSKGTSGTTSYEAWQQSCEALVKEIIEWLRSARAE